MDKEFVTYEIALALKELGFKEYCLASYYHAGKRLDICEYINHGKYTILAPLKQQVFKFFREVYGFHFYSYQVKLYPDGDYPTKIWHGKINDEFVNTENGLEKSHFYSYEEAENACIDKLISITKQQN